MLSHYTIVVVGSLRWEDHSIEYILEVAWDMITIVVVNERIRWIERCTNDA